MALLLGLKVRPTGVVDHLFCARRSAPRALVRCESVKDFGRRARGFLPCFIEEKPMSLPLTDRCVESPRENPIVYRSVARPLTRWARFVALAVSIAASMGCGAGAADKLEGKWVGERIDNVSAEQVARATAWVKATTLEFAGDKLTVTIPTEPARKGIFKV